MGEAEARIPRLATGWEAQAPTLSPAEGFLLSRIDGHTPWTLLREIGGLSPEEADRCLARWIEQGLVEVAQAKPVRVEGRGRPAAAGPNGRGAIDPTLSISVELQQEILDFEAQLERPYHEILGLDRDCDNKAIKRAYFALSKKYHPDRYYRKQIGGFKVRLEEIFKKLVEAYELMSDPATRAEIEKSLASAPPPEPEAPPEPQPEAKPAEKPKGYPTKLSKRETLDRLRRRFRIPERVLAERKMRARQFYEAGKVSMAQSKWLEASGSVRLAIAFDPFEGEYKRGFAKLQSKVYEVRAAELLERMDLGLDASQQAEALRLLEEVLHYRPGDAALNERTARLALGLEELEKAEEYAEAACELEPQVCAYHVTHCRVLRRAGKREHAREALERARRIDAKHPDVREETRAMHGSRRRR